MNNCALPFMHRALVFGIWIPGMAQWHIHPNLPSFLAAQITRLTTARELWETFHADDAEHGRTAFKQAIINGQLDLQVRVITADGSIRWIQFYGEIRRDRNGQVTRLLGTAMDITARKEMERHKDEFISIAGHELKTPLTSLKSYVQMAHGKSKVYEDHGITNMLEKAELQVNKMTHMIGDFLNMAHSEAGKMVLNTSEFALNELLMDVIQDLSLNIKGQRLFLDTNLPVKIIADREKIERVLVNLISNAVKYSVGDYPVIINYQVQDRPVLDPHQRPGHRHYSRR